MSSPGPSGLCRRGEGVRPPTAGEIKAVGHPLRLRILRLCAGDALSNQELAQRLDRAPASVLRHVRELARTGFLEALPARTGRRGALEIPYRATGLTTRLAWDAADNPELLQQVELAMLHAYRSELVEAGPDAIRDRLRWPLRLNTRSQRELHDRLRALLGEFAARDDPDGEPLSLLWMLHAAPDPNPPSDAP